jgi:Flp pilus assembly protein TadD
MFSPRSSADGPPSELEAQYGIGLDALAGGDLTTAYDAFARVRQLDPDQANAAYHLGLIAEARGWVTEATRLYHLTLRLAPGHQQAARRLSSAKEPR